MKKEWPESYINNLRFVKDIKWSRKATIDKDLFNSRKYSSPSEYTAELAIAVDDNGAAYAWFLPNGLMTDIRNGWNESSIAKNPGGYHSNAHDIPIKTKLGILDGYEADIYDVEFKK